MTPPLVYLAGPLFDEGERWFVERLEAVVAEVGFSTFLPHRDNPDKTADNVREIFDNNRRAIDAASIVVANLNGVTTDDGTAWEIGYAYANGKKIVGLFTDWRRRFDDEVLNLMLEESLDHLVRSLDGLAGLLGKLAASDAQE